MRYEGSSIAWNLSATSVAAGRLHANGYDSSAPESDHNPAVYVNDPSAWNVQISRSSCGLAARRVPHQRYSAITKNDDRRHERATAGAAAGMPYNHAYTDKAELGPDRAREAGMGRIRRYVVIATQLTLDSVMAEYITVLITNGADRDRVHTEMDDCKSTLVQN
jgi:hypothetical protein